MELEVKTVDDLSSYAKASTKAYGKRFDGGKDHKKFQTSYLKKENIKMGPLTGYKIIEIAGLGPGPFAGMLLADMGAEVVMIERPSKSRDQMFDCTRRGKRSIVLDLKLGEDKELLLKMCEKADVLFEAFRPGVMERFGLGPDICLQRNPKLIYGRMTGWGQTGPLALAAGHDINYISITGALHAIGRQDENPVPPLNLVGDYGGGAMFLVTGILAALLETQKSGKGQIIDAAMCDGTSLLMTMFHSLHATKLWTNKRGSNILDSGAHFYDTYKTSDEKYISIGSMEPQFYNLLIEKADLDPLLFKDQLNPSQWPKLKEKLTQVFLTKTRKEWCDIMEGTDVCFAPVLDFVEAPNHPHNIARQTYIDVDGIKQPAPAPRFSRTVAKVKTGSPQRGANKEEVIKEWFNAE